MPPTTQSGPPQARLTRIVLWGVLGVVLIGVVGLGVLSMARREPLRHVFPEASSGRLPIYGSLPDFALTDQRGRPVRRDDLQGKVWVASFIFTNCPDECPLMTAELAQLQSDLASIPDLRFVSISVDPERDTPALLSQYADRFNADPERWLFLTGDKQAIYRLAREGFRVGIVDPTEPSLPSPVKEGALGGFRSWFDRPPPRSVGRNSWWPLNFRDWWRYVDTAVAFADHGRARDTLHSTRFILIDRRAQIRGYYESREEAALQRLRQHLQMLIREA
jgi:cytochrome oxidase Cu insertion factor (SCO1/SenC/PrrC family)